MAKKEEELEFISIHTDELDTNEMTARSFSENSNEDNTIGTWFLKQSKHPSALILHLIFKALALFVYIFGSWFTSSFIFTFVICIILLAFDFWTVKNISGRLLVGLRWWSYVREDGSNDWVFESLEDMAEISPTDSRIFWTTLYAAPTIWALLLLIGLLRFDFEYLPVVIAALSMNMANVYGYTRCSSSAKKRMQSLVEQGLRNTTLAAMNNNTVANWIFTTFLNSNSNRSGSSSETNV